jgi:voltage-dependent anion channel protein 2
VFKDIGKACNDLLTKDFKVGKTTVELKSKTASGVTFTPTATKSGDSVAGELKAAYGFLPWLEGECVMGTNGSMTAKIEAADALTKGLTITTECERAMSSKGPPTAMLQAGNIILDYKQDVFTCKTSFDYYKKELLASCSTIYGALTCGADCAYSTKSSTLAKYALAGQFVQPDFVVSAKCAHAKGAKTLSCGYYHKVSSLMQVGVTLSKPLAKGEVDIDFGCAYKLDKDTTVKGKVDTKGALSCSYKQKISPLTTMTLAAQINVADTDDKHKFGLALNITP